jgi:hypothetical protein|tara:strand:- start:851 stop:1252 length:402 start_codon:yes stop_codon:yes gene_type:complete
MISFGGKKYTIDFLAIDKLVTDGMSVDGDDIEVEEIKTLTDVEKPIEGDPENVTIVQELIVTNVITKKYPKGKQVDSIKYDLVRGMLDIILHEQENPDEKLGTQHALDDYNLSFKIAFNTLLYYDIIKTIKIK